MDWGSVWDFITMLVVGAGALALILLRQGAQAATDEAVKEAAARINFSPQLGRDLARLRGSARQEHRFQSYAALWSKLRPLAIYDDAPLDRAAMERLSEQLSDWYFSPCGGLLLTSQVRDLYFALQDVLNIVSRLPDDWFVQRIEAPDGGHRDVARQMLADTGSDAARKAAAALDRLQELTADQWEAQAADLASDWRLGISQTARSWADLDDARRFALLQQAGSVLRTGLTNDLESRAR